MIPRHDGKVLIAITAIIATSVTILGIVAIQMTFLVKGNTETEITVSPDKLFFSLGKSQPPDFALDGCVLGEDNRLICDNE